MINPFTAEDAKAVALPLWCDVYITDCSRQDHAQFKGQYVWTVKVKLWHGPPGYYPRLGDAQFDFSFDIPADWASDGWDVSHSSQVWSGDAYMSYSQRQALKAVDMNANPMKSAPYLIKCAVRRGILDLPPNFPELKG